MLTVKCPNCQKSVEWTAEQRFKPFCCERCKLIDLGAWAMEENRIAGKSIAIENACEREIDSYDFD